MYESVPTIPHLILGYHGCDQSLKIKLLNRTEKHIKKSENRYDWLGHGIYFWENDPKRALDYAQGIKERSFNSKQQIKNPTVIGAVLNLKNCLNLLESSSLRILETVYEGFRKDQKNQGIQNEKANQNDLDYSKRILDCSVMQYLHELIKEEKGLPFDSVRASAG